ncbi:transcription factor TFIIIB subunit brf1 [Coniothyrium glycines]
MSAPAVATRQPRAPRIGSLSGSQRLSSYQSEATKKRAMPAPPPPKRKEHPQCCEKPELLVDDSETVCMNCGVIFKESSIVAEVTFGETAGGAAMVEGGFIGDQQRHANSMGGTMRGLGGMESREQAQMHGRMAIEALGASLQQRQAVVEQAIGWYKLAMNHNFIQGRRMRNVAAVAIYMAARRQAENTLMLMDLSEKIQTNVWQLGATYKSFLKTLGEEDPSQLAGNTAVQEIEPLMLKYCRKLEFGEDSFQVAADACKIAKRMKRDWMVQGRQPAGVCGACIILAARMNNFRRTVREVVYVVKVADSTINSRLYEYKRTPSSVLTVNQFREFGQKMKVKTLPPAIWRREEREERKEKRRARLAGVEVEVEDNAMAEQSDNNESEAGQESAPTRASKRRKSNDGSSQAVAPQPESTDVQANEAATIDTDALDGDAEAVLDSVASALAEAEANDAGDADFVIPKKRGRPSKKGTVVVVDPEDLEIEQDIEDEVTGTITNWESIFKEFATNDNHEIFRQTRWKAEAMTRVHMDQRDVPVNTSPDIGEDEFEDDPDVADCILRPEEVRRKEAIWITENEDWLRAQQKKILEAELDAARELPKKPKQKRKHHQMGDGSVLGGQPASSAAEAAHKMIQKRAKQFSNHINYDRLKELFPGGNTSSTPSGSGLGASPAASHDSRSPPAAPIASTAAEEEEEDEYDEQEVGVEEDEDLEHQYAQDDDEGFGNDYDDDDY